MADGEVTSKINIEFNAAQALSEIKRLQADIAAFHANLTAGAGASAKQVSAYQQSVLSSINATKGFSASIVGIASETEAFTRALERNDFTMRQYFRNAMGAAGKFSSRYKAEFATIDEVARSRVRTLQTQYINLGRDASGAMKAIQVRPAELDMKNLSTQMAVATQKAQIFHELVRQGSTQLLNWGKNTQWAGRQLMVGFTLPLTMMGASAAKAFMELEKQTVAFKRVYGDFSTTAAQTDAMAKSVQNLAAEFTQYGVAVSDTMGLAAQAAAMGKQGQDLIAQVSETNRLAVLGQVEQSQALETTISLTNAFGVASEDLAKNIDFLNAVENQTVTSIEDLTVAIPKAGPVIKQMGGDVKDLAFFLTAMKEGGINASEGANALKSGIAAIINPTKAASDMLAGYGINIQKLVESNKGNIKGLITDFASALDKLDPLNRAKAIEQMFGKFQFARISTLFQNVIAQGSQAQQVLQLTNATTEQLANLSKTELGKIAESTTYKFEKAMADFQMAIAPVGEQFLKLFTPFIQVATDILNWFNKLDDGVKTFAIGAIVAIGGIAPLLIMLSGLFANLFANFASRINSVVMFFKGLKRGMQDGVNSTRYLSEAELQAQAVAASLDHVHAQLIQTFGLEKAALDELALAYMRLKDTQMGLMNPNIAAGAMAAANGGALYNVENDRLIKGYKSAAYFTPESWNTSMDRGHAGVATTQLSGYLKNAGSASMAPLLAAMASQANMKLNDPATVAEWRVLGDRLVGIVTNTLDKSGLDMVTDADFARIVVPALKEQAGKVMVAGEDLTQALHNAFNNIDTVSETGKARKSLKGSQASSTNRAVAAEFAKTTNPAMFGEGKSSSGKRILTTTYKGKTSQANRAHMDLTTVAMASAMTGKIAAHAGEAEAKALLARAGVNVGEIQAQGTKTGQILADAASNGLETGLQQGAANPNRHTNRDPVTGRFIPKQQPTPQGSGFKISKAGKLGMLGFAAGGVASMIPGGGDIANIAFAVGSVASLVEVLQMMGVTLTGLKAGFMTFAGALGGLAIPLTLVATAIAGIAFIAWQQNEKLKKITQDTIDTNNKLGASYQAMQKMAEATGKTLASQVLAQRQSDILAGNKRKTPETLTSGEQYLTTDAGKQITDEIKTSIASGVSSANIGGMVAQQLAAGIASGLISKQQAQSISSAIGESLSNKSISFSINAKLATLLDSNGKDALTQGVDLRVNLLGDLTNQIAGASKVLAKTPSQSKTTGTTTTSLSFGNVQSGTGMSSDTLSFENPQANKYSQEQIAANRGLFVAQTSTALAQQKEQTAATQLQYEEELKILQAKNDQAGIRKLTNEYETAQQKLLEKNVGLYAQIKQSLSGMDIEQKKLLSGNLATAVTDAYKGTGQEAYAATALANIDAFKGEGSTDLKLNIQMAMASGTLSPSTVTYITQLFDDPENAQNQLEVMLNIDAQLGAGTSDMVEQLLGSVGASKTTQIDVMAVIETYGQTALDAMLTALSDPSINGDEKEAIVNYFANNAERVFGFIDAWNANPDMDEKTAQQIFDEYGFGDVSYVYNAWASLPDAQQKTFMTRFMTYKQELIDKIVGDVEAGRASLRAYEHMVEDNGGAVVDRLAADMVVASSSPQLPGPSGSKPPSDSSGGGGGGGGRGGSGGGSSSDGGSSTQKEDTSSFLKDVVEDIRKLEDAGQKIPTTFDDAIKAIKKFSNAGSIGIGGLADSLRSAGANANLINMALDATPDELKKIFKNGALTDFGKELQKVLNSLQISNFIEEQKAAISVSSDQVKAFARLRQSGTDAASAYRLVEDAALASAIANAQNAEEIEVVIAAYYAAKKAADEAMNPDQRAIRDAQLVNNLSQARISEYETGLNIISLKEDEINKKYNDRQDALDKIAAANAEIAKQQQQQLDLADALSRGDISAAARAAQTMRQSASAAAQKRQSDSLDKARELELKGIQVEINGVLLDREEIEKRIKDLNAAIYQIELDTINAAQINLAQQALDEQNAIDNASTTVPSTPAGEGESTTEGPKIAYQKLKEYFDAPKPSDWDTMKVKARKAWKREHQIRKKDALNTELYSEIKPFARGGYVGGMGIKPIGMDRIPAMLKPGEFVVSVPGVKKFGIDNLRQINAGQALDSSVYNYSVTVNAGSGSDGQEIARLVMGKIKEVDAMRIRGNKL